MDQSATDESPYMKLKDIAKLLHCSRLTVRRHLVQGKLGGIEWSDPFENGHLLATRESVERFREKCHQKMERVFSRRGA